MKISVELTLTPLQSEFEPAIKNFIKKLRASGLTIMENPLSTQVYGDYNQVMQMLTKEMKNSLEGLDSGMLFLKIVKSDRSGYTPSF